MRGRRTTASPSVPRVRTSTVQGETHQFPESRGLSAGLVFLSVRLAARDGPCLVQAPLFFAPCMVLSAPPHLGPGVRVCATAGRSADGRPLEGQRTMALALHDMT